MNIKTQQISHPIIKDKGVQLFVKRLDQNHKYVSGNKWFKLKYNLIEAKRLNYKSILTFGGAYSNHIVATAYLAKKNNFHSIGIIRGEEYRPLNPTLEYALSCGMQIHYLSRADYRLKDSTYYLEKLKLRFGDFYLLPEGGTNKLAIKGCTEILDEDDRQNYICCPVGTGGTIAGIINSTTKNQNVIGFTVLKGSLKLEKKILEFVNRNNYKLIHDYSYGGFAKIPHQLLDFVQNFNINHKIPLDAIYTSKMMTGIFDLITKNYFSRGSSILAIHTGGLQGNKGINERFGYNLPIN